MPALKNPKHERFVQELFKGSSADAAYQRAGYKANRANAVRLKTNERILKRLSELQVEAAKKAVDRISFDAADMFTRLEAEIAAAAAGGDYKAAMQGRTLMIEAFGYKDSPTLTHEHVRGTPLKPAEEAAVSQDRDVGNVLRFGKVLGELRKRTA